jgi:GMP synthase-like glutamine amidotransferase
MFTESRQAKRHALSRWAKIRTKSGSLPRDCLLIDISDSGIRLHAEAFEVPDDFVLLLEGEKGPAAARECRVVWRLGFEIGAAFTDTRQGFARRFMTASN